MLESRLPDLPDESFQIRDSSPHPLRKGQPTRAVGDLEGIGLPKGMIPGPEASYRPLVIHPHPKRYPGPLQPLLLIERRALLDHPIADGISDHGYGRSSAPGKRSSPPPTSPGVGPQGIEARSPAQITEPRCSGSNPPYSPRWASGLANRSGK